jgi:O-antigen ligase
MQTPSSRVPIKAASASLIVLGLSAVIPFLLPHYGRGTAFYSEWAAFALSVLACFPFLSKSFWLDLEIPRSAIWLLALVVLFAIQSFFIGHAYITQALLPGIYITWATALIILSAWIREQLGLERAVTVFAWLILLGGTLQSLVGLVQYFDVSGALTAIIDPRQSVSINGNLSQRNHFATQITLASSALIYLYATNHVSRVLAIALAALFAFALTTSSSRATAIYIVAGFLLSLIFYRATRTPTHRRLLEGATLLLALFLLFQYLLPLLNDWLKLVLGITGFNARGIDTLVTLQRSATEGIDVRLSEWRKAWLMFLESPLWGIGIGNYGWYSFNYQALPEFAIVPEGQLFHHSHNLIMQVLAELGITGLLLLIFMVATWLRQVLPLWKNPPYWLILTLIVVLFLHSAVEYPLWYSYFLGIAAVSLGLGVGRKGALKIRFSPALGQFTAGITLIFSGAMLVITFLGFQDLTQVYRLTATMTPQQTLTTLHAVSKNPLLTPWAEVSIAVHGLPDKANIEQQLLLISRVMEYRANPINVNRKIIYLALAGRSTEASALMKKAFVVYPSDFSKFACAWKSAPSQEVHALWLEAENQNGSTIDCLVKPTTPVGPS